tara:strand:- start:6086 stop:6523 length:438 start_codon:yes stop_codon:yes gene_type:complete
MIDAEALPETTSKSRNKLIAAAGILLVALVTGFLVYSSICPCDRTPGEFLFGERTSETVSDWSFANDVPLCQLQIWAGKVEKNESGVMRLNRITYSVVINREQTPLLWTAPGPHEWRSYRLMGAGSLIQSLRQMQHDRITGGPFG